jgi:hypothetical protein
VDGSVRWGSGWDGLCNGLGAEMANDEPAGRAFDEAEGEPGEGEDGDVGDPGVEGGDVEALGEVVVVDEEEGVEVDEVEGVGGFAKKDEGAEGEDGRERVGNAEAEDK